MNWQPIETFPEIVPGAIKEILVINSAGYSVVWSRRDRPKRFHRWTHWAWIDPPEAP